MNQVPYADARTLLGLLSVILPDGDKTLLLRACLCRPPAAQDSWSAWLDRIDDPKSLFKGDEDGLKGLLPFIGHRLAENGITPDEDFQTYLRMSAVREDLRNRIYREILGDVLVHLRAAGIRVIVLRGAALSETVYDAPAHRHNHAIDLLVEAAGDAPAVLSMLQRLEFSTPRPIRPGRCRTELTHKTGLALVVHTALFDFPYFQLTIPAVRERAVEHRLAGVEAATLSPEDSFLYVCGQAAAFPNRSNLRWVGDCWSILQRHPGFDWELVAANAVSSGLVWPMRVIAAYFADRLEMAIPQSFRNRLRQETERTRPSDFEPAFTIALTALTPGAVMARCEPRDWRSRARYLRFALFPSAAFVRWRHAGKPGPLPWLYVRRLVDHVCGRGSQMTVDSAAMG